MTDANNWFILGWRDFALIALIVYVVCRTVIGQLRNDMDNDLALMVRALDKIAHEQRVLEDYVGKEGAQTRQHIDNRLDPDPTLPPLGREPA